MLSTAANQTPARRSNAVKIDAEADATRSRPANAASPAGTGSAIAITPRSPRVWLGWGALALAQGNHEVAVDRLSRSLALNDRIRATYLLRAQAEARLGRADQAEADTVRAREIFAEMLELQRPVP